MILCEAYAQAFTPEDKRSVCEWAGEYIRVPNSARATKFDISATPWLRDPVNCLPDNRIREMVLMMPTGAGKTTVFDVAIPRAVKEDPGSVLLGMQAEEDAKAYWDERLEPALLNIDSVREMIRNLPRNKKRRGELVLPHMTLYTGGSNHSNFQRKSVRWVLLDEVWTIRRPLVAEARARTHDRWNRRIILVSQGGTTHEEVESQTIPTELDEAWLRTDRREYCMVCPECGTQHRWAQANLIYNAPEDQDAEIDERAIFESARYRCPECKTEFPDKIETRRALSQSSVYVSTNPNAMPGYIGWHVPALALYYIPWGQLSLEWHKAIMAKRGGDLDPLKTYTQKRLAENWKEIITDPEAVLSSSDYSLADYLDGQIWDGEAFRFQTIDRQRDHFWVVIRAWQPGGASRLLYEGRLETIEMCRELQLRYKVKDAFTFEDAQHETGQVYDDCARYGWTALHGSGTDGFMHHPPGKRPIMRLFSPVKQAQAPTEHGKAKYVFWSNEGVKDELVKLRSGRGPSWEMARDCSRNYRNHMISESKRDVYEGKSKRLVRRFMPVKKGRPNHLWDCEAMQTAAGLMLRVIKGPEKEFLTEERAAEAQSATE